MVVFIVFVLTLTNMVHKVGNVILIVMISFVAVIIMITIIPYKQDVNQSITKLIVMTRTTIMTIMMTIYQQ